MHLLRRLLEGEFDFLAAESFALRETVAVEAKSQAPGQGASRLIYSMSEFKKVSSVPISQASPGMDEQMVRGEPVIVTLPWVEGIVAMCKDEAWVDQVCIQVAAVS